MTTSQTQCRSTNLCVAYGRVDRPVHQVLAELLEHQPQIIWREPVPTRRRLDGFIGLWCGEWDRFAQNHPQAALDEARLFWWGDGQPAGTLHLVNAFYGQADCSQTRWAAFWESADPSGQPPWLDQETLGQPNATETLAVDSCKKEPVLTMAERDRNRYGLKAVCHPTDTALQICKYFCGTELVFWRLAH